MLPAHPSPHTSVCLSQETSLRLVDSECLKPATLSISHQNDYSKMFYRCSNNNGTVSTFHLE